MGKAHRSLNRRSMRQVLSRATQGSSAIGFAAMADAGDFDGGFVPVLEEKPVVAAAEAEAGLRGLELLHVAVARGEVTVRAVEDVESGLAVDAAKIGAGFAGPNDR